MAKRKRATTPKKALTPAQTRKLKAAAIDLFEEAKRLDLKLEALARAAHVLSVPHRYN